MQKQQRAGQVKEKVGTKTVVWKWRTGRRQDREEMRMGKKTGKRAEEEEGTGRTLRKVGTKEAKIGGRWE